MARVLEIFSLMRPSWGTRRSEMSMRAITLRRAANLLAVVIGGFATVSRMPS